MPKCTHHRDSRRAPGYTIIELLVALAIAAIFFTSFFAVVAATLQTLKTGDERTVAQQNARVAMSTLMNELKNTAEIAPRSAYEMTTQGLPGLPLDEDAVNPMESGQRAYPILGRSTDDSSSGYVELDNGDASGGTEQYKEFRADKRPFDVRPLAPNRITVRLGNNQYFENTRYIYLNPQTGGATSAWDLDNSPNDASGQPADNPTTTDLIVTYEQQVVPPRVSVYDDLSGISPNQVYTDYILDGLVKRLYVMSGGSGTPLVLDTDSVGSATGGIAEKTSLTQDIVPDFYLLRSFQSADPPNVVDNVLPTSLVESPGGLGAASRRTDNVYIPPVHLRQPVADHVLDVRFRYWTEVGGQLIEIRYDPETSHMALGGGGMPDMDNDNGYYRYFDVYGNELYVWADKAGKIDVDETSYFTDGQAYIDNYPVSALICTNETERGMLLFEGWRFINGLSVTLRTANDTYLQEYVSSIDYTLTDPAAPEFGLGFTDFGGANLSENMTNPLYRGVDDHRGGFFDAETGAIIQPGDTDSFDIIEPLASTNYDPTKFI
ncbi:MAG: prepilin-type N-terminal cleavage/methylation domain-containing protein, partial [bacterium]